MSNARFNDLGNGQQSELVATNVVIMYNPTNQQASAIFHGTPHLLVANTYYSISQEFNALRIDFTDKMTNCYANGKVDPVTGADLSKISIAGLMTYIKDAYDVEFNAAATALAGATAEVANTVTA